jgi:hypothetical protein
MKKAKWRHGENQWLSQSIINENIIAKLEESCINGIMAGRNMASMAMAKINNENGNGEQKKMA